MSGPDEELASIDAELMVLEDSYKMLEAMALADGEIDATEQQGLDDLAAQIRAAKRERKELAADTDTTTAPGIGAGSQWDFVDDIKDGTFGSESAEAGLPADPDCGPSESGPAIDPDGATDMIHGVEEAKAEEERATEEAYAEFVEDLGVPDEPDLPPLLPDNDPGAELEAWFEGVGEPELPSDGVAAVGRQRELENIQKQQIALQRELLANPDNAQSIIDEINALSVSFKDIAGIPDVSDEVEAESSGGDLLQTHKELYQAFLRAGDPEAPLILSRQQQEILEEMRGIDRDLAIEAERSLYAAKKGWDEDVLRPAEDETGGTGGEFGAEEEIDIDGISDREFASGEVADHLEGFEAGLSDRDKSIPEMIADAAEAETALMQAGQLTEEEIDARLRKVARKYATNGDEKEIIQKAKPLNQDGQLIGFTLWIDEGHKLELPGMEDGDYGIACYVYVDLNGKFLGHQRANDMFSSVVLDGLDAAADAVAEEWDLNKTATAVAMETLIAIFGQPVEMTLDAADLMHASTRLAKWEDGSIAPVIICMGMIFIPGSRGAKRVFDVDGMIIDANTLARKIDAKDLDDLISPSTSNWDEVLDQGRSLERGLDDGAWRTKPPDDDALASQGMHEVDTRRPAQDWDSENPIDDAALDRDFRDDAPDTGTTYDGPDPHARGNFGERTGTEALSAEAHKILDYKPDINGVNQGGIDMLTFKVALDGKGYVHFVDNKALTRAGNVSDVSALTKNLEKNKKAAIKDLQRMAARPDLSPEELEVWDAVTEAIAADRIKLVVTNANLTTDDKILKGLSKGLKEKGIEFIDVMKGGS